MKISLILIRRSKSMKGWNKGKNRDSSQGSGGSVGRTVVPYTERQKERQLGCVVGILCNGSLRSLPSVIHPLPRTRRMRARLLDDRSDGMSLLRLGYIKSCDNVLLVVFPMHSLSQSSPSEARCP